MPRTPRSIAAAIAVACSALFAITPASHAGDGGFAAGKDIPVPNPSTLAVGDFNNDGRPDLAVATERRRLVQILLQERTGGLVPGDAFPVSGEPRLVAVADFNRDGTDDLALGDSGELDIKVRLGSGDGRFTAAPDIDTGREPLSIATGDFDANGTDDIAVATKNPGGAPHPIAVWQGEGDGRFGRGIDVENGATALAVADFNADSREDLVYGAAAPNPGGSILLGKGGAFDPRRDIKLPQQAAFRRGWAVGDFNNDAKPDVVAGLTSDLTAVRLGRGDGTFDNAADVLTAGTPGAVAVGDVNSDGNEDFVVTDTGGSKSVRVRIGDGRGGFTAGPDVPVGTTPVDVAIADFDSDGNDDLAVANGEGSVSVRPGTGAPELQGNLLVNGGFEGPTPIGKVQPAPRIEGWTLEGGISHARYGTASHAFVPSRQDAARYGGGGRMLAGGYSAPTNGMTAVSQLVDVSANAQAIDQGRATANLSGYLGGALNYDDAFTGRAEFLNGNTTLGSVEIGPVTAAERGRVTRLLRRAASKALPAGTRSIRVTFISNDVDKQQSSALADNAKLTLSIAPAQGGGGGGGGGQPEQPATQQRFGANTLVTIAPASRRLKPGQAVRVRVRNNNAFAVSGRLGSRRLNVPARSTTTVKVKLSAKQRRALKRKRSVAVRLTAVIRDPAGQSRRVSRSVRLVRSK
jgi:hypothetical protein